MSKRKKAQATPTHKGQLPKTRNVLVKLTKKQVTATRRACLDIVNDRDTKGGIVIRVPRDAKRVKVAVSKQQIETKYSIGKKKFRTVDTPIKAFDWVKSNSEEYLKQGKKKGERLKTVKIAVRGYNGKNFYDPGTFGKYISENFLPSVSRLRGKKNKPKRDICNYFSVRRIYVSTQKRTTGRKKTGKR